MANGEVIKIYSISKENKDEVFVQAVREYKNNLYRLAKSILKKESDVEDAVSEAILKAYKNIDMLQSFDKFRPWIMQILVNECYRMHKLRSRVVYSQDMEKHLEATHDKNTYGEMWALVNSLDEEFRAVVTLFYYEDVSINEIAKILDLPLGTVKSRLSRARLKLKILIENEEGIINE